MLVVRFVTNGLTFKKEEREGKKKLLPRTRSGRISKPPRHMVKDYKRLHHLDFAQPDLDDSDGGYSDYRLDGTDRSGAAGGGDESNPESAEDTKEPIAHKNLIPTSPFHCTTCKREYTTPHRYYYLNTNSLRDVNSFLIGLRGISSSSPTTARR